MSTNMKPPSPKARTSLWRHPLIFVASAVGFVGSCAVYYAHIHARQKARNLFLEKPFYQEALNLTSGYKPIMDKLVEPIEPLQIDPTSGFNKLSPFGAQVSRSLQFVFFSSSQINLPIMATQIEVRGTEPFVHFR